VCIGKLKGGEEDEAAAPLRRERERRQRDERTSSKVLIVALQQQQILSARPNFHSRPEWTDDDDNPRAQNGKNRGGRKKRERTKECELTLYAPLIFFFFSHFFASLSVDMDADHIVTKMFFFFKQDHKRKLYAVRKSI
jgi:hypothetical protein